MRWVMGIAVSLLAFGFFMVCMTWWIEDPINAILVAFMGGMSILCGIAALVFFYMDGGEW